MINDVSAIIRPRPSITLADLPRHNRFDCTIPLPCPTGLCLDLQAIVKQVISDELPFPRIQNNNEEILQAGMNNNQNESCTNQHDINEMIPDIIHSPIDITRHVVCIT